MTVATCDACGLARDHHHSETPACDGPRCYDLAPEAAFDRGLITFEELPTATITRVHRASCAVVRDLMRA